MGLLMMIFPKIKFDLLIFSYILSIQGKILALIILVKYLYEGCYTIRNINGGKFDNL